MKIQMPIQELVLCSLGILICIGSVALAERLGNRSNQIGLLAIGVFVLGSGIYRM